MGSAATNSPQRHFIGLRSHSACKSHLHPIHFLTRLRTTRSVWRALWGKSGAALEIPIFDKALAFDQDETNAWQELKLDLY